MKVGKMISVVLAVGSVWLGGSLGAAALEKANGAPLAAGSPLQRATPGEPRGA